MNFMMGLIKEESGDLWLKMTDEGLVLHIQMCPNAIFSALIVPKATEVLVNVNRE